MTQVSPGLYPVSGPLRSVCVGADGVVRFEMHGRSWAYRLVAGARGIRSEDAMRHEGTAQERESARCLAERVLFRALRVHQLEQSGRDIWERRAA